MYSVSFDPPNPAPLDFNTDRTARGVADAPDTAICGSHTGASPPDAESLLAELGLPAHAVRQILMSSSAPDF
ncbi:hypothetical protein [Candidatus Rariloculus sp.]|uniref:hypothetical protein n=1 Tax=Candidatus Rariloculus sp. TaxID=3101265 RepID=UPI003D0AA9F6